MAAYKIVDAEQLDADLTEIANEVRTLADTSDKLTIEQMKDSVAQANADIEIQTDIVSQIMAVLDGKLVGSDSDVLEEIKRIIDSKEIDSIEDSAEKLGAMKESIETATGESYEDLTEAIKAVSKLAKWKDYIQQGLKNNTSTKNIFRNVDNPNVSDLDFSNITDMSNMFGGNQAIEEFVMDLSNVSNVHTMIPSCKNLRRVIVSNTGHLRDWTNAFGYNTSLLSIETLDFTSTTNTNSIFAGCSSLERVKVVPETLSVNISFWSCPNLSDESIQNIINGLATVEITKTLTLHADVKAKLTEEQIATITNKNWTLA